MNSLSYIARAISFLTRSVCSQLQTLVFEIKNKVSFVVL